MLCLLQLEMAKSFSPRLSKARNEKHVKVKPTKTSKDKFS